MAHRIIRTLPIVLALTLLSQTHAVAQGLPTPSRAPSGGKLFITTMAQPTHRIACRVKSFTTDQLDCKGPFGITRIHKSKDLAAIIQPGYHASVPLCFLAVASAGATLVTGAVFLASITVIGAVPVAIAGGILLLMAPLAAADATDGDDSDQLLYLAPGQQLCVKLH